MLKAKLVVVGGDAKAKEVSLKLPTVIGRGKDVTLTLPHALVSRKHTEIFEKDGWLFVKDLGSLNGTYVNNRRIKEAQKLLPNHLLTLGNVTFRAVYESPVVVDSPEQRTGERDEDETIRFEDVKEAPVLDEAAAGSANESSPRETPVSRKDIETEPAASSSIFSGDEEFITPDKSISISALEGLPAQAAVGSVSFVGNQLKDIGGPQKQAVDSIELDVPQAASSSESDVDLGSFLRKIPR